LAELFRMKEEGLAETVGLAAGRADIMMPLMRDWDFDAIITHNRFTLVNRNAEEMMDLAQARGMAVLNAAPYAGGVLARHSAGRCRTAVLAARPAHRRHHLRRQPPRAGCRDAAVGRVADQRRGVARAAGTSGFVRRPGGDPRILAWLTWRCGVARRAGQGDGGKGRQRSATRAACGRNCSVSRSDSLTP